MVTSDTSDEELRRMGNKNNGMYPVYLVSEEYGVRGLDYRSYENSLGICMIIASPFSDQRTRIQGLMRVGRYNEQCLRIQDSLVGTIDLEANCLRKGRI